MAIKAALIITGISVALLVIYGIDVAAGGGTGTGFLPMDHKVRGMVLGGPAMILPIIGFFISRKEPSKQLGILLLISGILIIVGGAVVISMPPPADAASTGRNALVESIPLIGVGAFIVGLGAVKIRK